MKKADVIEVEGLYKDLLGLVEHMRGDDKIFVNRLNMLDMKGMKYESIIDRMRSIREDVEKRVEGVGKVSEERKEVVGKFCSKCKRLLSYKMFGVNNGTRDGLQAWCKDCRSASLKELRIRKKEAKLESIARKVVRRNPKKAFVANGAESVSDLKTSLFYISQCKLCKCDKILIKGHGVCISCLQNEYNDLIRS